MSEQQNSTTMKNALKQEFETTIPCQEKGQVFRKIQASGLFEEHEIDLMSFQLTIKFQEQGIDLQNYANSLIFSQVTGKGAELKQAFYAAKSTDEMHTIFQQMDSHIKQEDLGSECSKLTQELFLEYGDPEKILFYGKRALKFYADSYNAGRFRRENAMCVAGMLNILGYACRRLSRYEESLSYLNRSLKKFVKVELDPKASYPADYISRHLHLVYSELALVNTALGEGDKAVINRTKMLEIQQKTMKEGSVEVGLANNDLADAYLGVRNFKDALPFAWKALEIYGGKGLGIGSVNLAQLRKTLGVIYCAMKEYEKGLEGIGAPASGLKIIGDMEAANMLLMLGKFEDGLGAMKSVIKQAIIEGADYTRASASVALARALCKHERLGDAMKYMRIAQKIVEKKQVDPLVSAAPVQELSKMYEEMEEFETCALKKRYNHEMAKVVELLKGLGTSEQDKVDGAFRLLKEMKGGASGGKSAEENSKRATL